MGDNKHKVRERETEMKTLDKSKLEEGSDGEEDDVESEIDCGWETQFKAFTCSFHSDTDMDTSRTGAL
jgi:hypothetical protein